jgi:hypothetical protein
MSYIGQLKSETVKMAVENPDTLNKILWGGCRASTRPG